MSFHRNIESGPRICSTFLLLLAAFLSGCGPPPPEPDRAAEPTPPFGGVVGRTLAESVPAWPERPTPREGAPNIVLWLLDDAGFAHLEPYGGGVPTPTVQRVADAGLTLTNFHSVPLCSPARAALLTGRNHHAVAMGSHILSAAGFPGYNGRVPESAASFPRVLRDPGLRHLRPRQVGPDARYRGERRGPVRHLAAAPGVRALLRVSRRRGAPLRAEPLVRPQSGLTRRRGLFPDDRPRGPRDRVHRRPAGERPRQALPPLLGDRRGACPPPRPRQRDRKVPGRLQRRLGCPPGTYARTPARSRARASGDGAGREAGRRVGLGRPAARRAPSLCPPDGGVRGATRARGPRVRPYPRPDRAPRRTGQYPRSHHLRQRRERRGRHGGTPQRGG